MNLPLNLTLSATQTQWSSALNPILSNVLVAGHVVKYSLVSGVNVINHGLSANMNGWMIVDIDAPATVYRSQPLNDKTLTLTSNAAANVALWMF
jgi:hypothetical protein